MQFDNLFDDNITEVLERLEPADILKMTQMNKRLHGLAENKLRLKVEKVLMDRTNFYNVMSTSRNGDVPESRIMDLNLMFVFFIKKRALAFGITEIVHRDDFYWSDSRAMFFKTMARFPNVTNIDFGNQELTDSVLKELIKICPKIECLVVKYSSVTQNVWRQFFSKVGHQMTHVSWLVTWLIEGMTTIDLFKIITSECPNLKQADVIVESLSEVLIVLLKKLPKNCFVQIDVETSFHHPSLNNTVDYLSCKKIDFSAFGSRCQRLSELTFKEIDNLDDQIVNIEFSDLKELIYLSNKGHQREEYQYLAQFRYPKLETFQFKATLDDDSEDDYNILFHPMPELTTLKFEYLIFDVLVMEATYIFESDLFKESVLQLNKLEEIEVTINCSSDDWPSEEFIQRLTWYVNQIQSLKTLTVIADERVMQWIGEDLDVLRVSQDRVEIVAELK